MDVIEYLALQPGTIPSGRLVLSSLHAESLLFRLEYIGFTILA
jgi:hypothetical protein